MERNELLYYAILLIVPALFFIGVILFARPEPKEKENR